MRNNKKFGSLAVHELLKGILRVVKIEALCFSI